MELFGEITPDRALLVVALREEGEHLHELGLPVLVTGAGKVRAAAATARTLADQRPAEVINLGTAGALKDGLEGIHVIGRAVQHDFDGEAIFELTGENFGAPIELGPGPGLATGDRFVADPAARAARETGRFGRHGGLRSGRRCAGRRRSGEAGEDCQRRRQRACCAQLERLNRRLRRAACCLDCSRSCFLGGMLADSSTML